MSGIPSSFRAAFLDGQNKPIRIDTTSIATPVSADEVGIRVTATAINPVDWKLRDYGLFITSWPTVLGSDAAGVVVEVGSNFAAKFQAGDRVFFQGLLSKNDQCTFQEYTRIPAHVVGKIPDGVSDEEAAGLSLAGVTAAVGLYHTTGRSLTPAPWDGSGEGKSAGKGKAIVVLGGSTSVGQYLIQFARLSGYTRIVTSASSTHTEFLKTLGAHVVLDRKTQGGVQDYLDAIGEDVTLDFVYDAVQLDQAQLKGVQIIQAAHKVTPGASVVSVAQPDTDAAEAGRAGEGSRKRNVEVRPTMALGYSPDYRYVTEPMYEAIGRWLASGEFVPNRAQVVPGGLQAIDEAMELSKKGVSGIKLVVKF
ncbi:chaperonin 10-like protein [Microdochium bolleyi]|uniref:Chaperonin 10-like protein n=1 Tax=Microdochium bolleyi TaxID=196109 RepID=A0A136ISV0_9PEZI|nr:chaperonin 10-like protein [Microdochium bolleyi]